jgi:hypothetical protein
MSFKFRAQPEFSFGAQPKLETAPGGSLSTYSGSTAFPFSQMIISSKIWEKLFEFLHVSK